MIFINLKKYIIKLLIIFTLIIPTTTLAYTNKVILGGETIGIEVHSKGIYIVDFYDVKGKSIGSDAGFLVGDIIVKINNIPCNNINELNNLIDQLTSFKLEVFGTKSFDNSQVTMGGVDVNEINIETFESKKVSNLFLEGELLDVDGDCGGYNLGFAWLSGLTAGKSVRND